MNLKLPDWFYKLFHGHYPELPGVPIRKPHERTTERINLSDVLGVSGGTDNNTGGLINNLLVNETDIQNKPDEQIAERTMVLEAVRDTIAYPDLNNNSQTNSLILIQNKMSIFSNVFISIETFVANLFKSVKKEYLNLEPLIRSDIDMAIKWGNVLKGIIEDPNRVGNPMAAEVIQVVEDELGSSVINIIHAVVGEVVVDLGIVKEAVVDPIQAYQMILDHLSEFKGIAFADKLFVTVKNIALRVTKIAGNNQVNAIIAVVYDLFFKRAATPVQPVYKPLDIPQQLNPVEQKAFDTVSVAPVPAV